MMPYELITAILNQSMDLFKFYLLFLILVGRISVAQNDGKVIYQQIEHAKIGYKYNNISESVLYFNATKSYFTDSESVASKKQGEEINPDGQSGSLFLGGEFKSEAFYMDLKSKQLLSNEFILARLYPVKDTLIRPNWKITTSRKKIGEFECQRAETTYRNRQYVAWFTPKIPVEWGPWKLWGLPGLIIEANSLDGEIAFIFKSYSKGNYNNFIKYTSSKRSKSMSSNQFVNKRKELIKNITKEINSSSFNGKIFFEPNTFSKDKYPN